MMPLAPRFVAVLSSNPPVLQPDGAAGKPPAPISCKGTDFAFSPASCTSAVTTGPQAKELSAKSTQLPTRFPLASVNSGRRTLTSEASRRKPTEPVSTRTSLIVWQVEVPGSQIVTLVNGWLKESPAGPAFTWSGCELFTGVPDVPVLPDPEPELELEGLLPPPPQPLAIAAITTAALANTQNRRLCEAALIPQTFIAPPLQSPGLELG